MQFSRKIRLLILMLVLGCCAGCDQASKHLARSGLEHSGPVTLPGGFGELRIVVAENPGSFLSLGDSLPKSVRLAVFTVGTGVGLLGLFAFLVGTRARLGSFQFIGLALIWVGGTCNLIDRVARHGLVTDFVVIRIGPLHTGIFNAADVMIMAGFGILLWDFARRPRRERREI